MVLPETAAERLLVEDGRRRRRPHRRQGPRPRRRGARPVRAGIGHARAGDDPRRGERGPSDGRGARALRARRREPADVGARREGGVEGAAAAPAGDPHAGLAAAVGRAVPRVRRLVRLSARRRDGEHRHGRRARLPRRGALGARPAPGAEDASAHPADPRRRRAGRVGREDDSGGRLRRAAARAPRARACCSAATASGSSTCRRSRGSTTRSSRGGSRPRRRGRRCAGGELGAYDEALRSSFVWSDLRRVRNMRPAFARRALARRGAGRARRRSSGGRFPRGDRPTERDAAHEIFSTPRAGEYPAPTGSSRSTSSRRSSSPATARATTSRTTSACRRRCRASWPSCGRGCARRRCTRSGPATATSSR